MQRAINNTFKCYSLSERAITIQFGNFINPELLSRVSHANHLLLRNPFPGFITAVSSYAGLTVYYDPEIVIFSSLSGVSCYEKVNGFIENLLLPSSNKIKSNTNTHNIPVCYGGQFGPDLADVAKHTKLTTQEVIDLHSQALYKVYMIGFLPGFAYMGGMDTALASPRKSSPRKKVPKGSVGIAGQQTGIYPLDSPGGWQLIGQTPLNLFDIDRNPPALLKAGDNIKFKPISVDEFINWGN